MELHTPRFSPAKQDALLFERVHPLVVESLLLVDTTFPLVDEDFLLLLPTMTLQRSVLLVGLSKR